MKDATIQYRTASTAGQPNTTKFYPISHLFFSPGVGDQPPRLVPSIPKASIEEIESYYCPQCLENFPSSEAMQFRGRCPRGECFTCAECGSVAPPIVASKLLPNSTSTDCYFRCNFCRWNSMDSGLSSTTDSKLVTMALAKEQGNQVAHVRTLSQRLQATVQHQEKQAELQKRLSGRSTASVRSTILLSLAKLQYGDGPIKNGRWLAKDIDAKRTQRRQEYELALPLPSPSPQSLSSLLSSSSSSSSPPTETKIEPTSSIDQAQEEHGHHHSGIISKSSNDSSNGGDDDAAAATESRTKQRSRVLPSPLLPLRCKLRTKRSLRCRNTFNQGHPGILLKSHINPLTGDSSMRAHMGKWYKKSSFARNAVPRLAIRRCIRSSNDLAEESKGEQEMKDRKEVIVVEMTITNPTDVDLSVSLFSVPMSTLVAATAAASTSDHTVLLNTGEMLMTDAFRLERYDELAEQDWSEDASQPSTEDPPAIVDRIRNKVVVTIPLTLDDDDTAAFQRDDATLIFPLGVRATSIVEAKEKDDGLDISYECIISMRM